MVLLGKKMKRYVLNRERYSDSTQSVNNSRLYGYVREGLQDLALLAEILPEKMQKKIFIEKTLGPFFKNLLTLKIKPDLSEKEIEDRRERILRLSDSLLNDLGALPNAYGLAGEQMRILTQSGSYQQLPPIRGLAAILIKSMGLKK